MKYVLKYYVYSKYFNFKRVRYEEFTSLSDANNYINKNFIDEYVLYVDYDYIVNDIM